MPGAATRTPGLCSLPGVPRFHMSAVHPGQPVHGGPGVGEEKELDHARPMNAGWPAPVLLLLDSRGSDGTPRRRPVFKGARNLWSLGGAAGPPRIPGIPGSAVSPALVSCCSWRAGPGPAPLWKDRSPIFPKRCWNRSSTPRTVTDQRRRNRAPGDPGDPRGSGGAGQAPWFQTCGNDTEDVWDGARILDDRVGQSGGTAIHQGCEEKNVFCPWNPVRTRLGTTCRAGPREKLPRPRPVRARCASVFFKFYRAPRVRSASVCVRCRFPQGPGAVPKRGVEGCKRCAAALLLPPPPPSREAAATTTAAATAAQVLTATPTRTGRNGSGRVQRASATVSGWASARHRA
eukprot:gene22925-biopygen16305